MIIENKIFLKLAEKFSSNSIKTWSRTLKSIGMLKVCEETLKGHIKSLIDTIKEKNCKSNKPYINAFRNCYLCCEYDKKEMDYLVSEWEESCNTADKERKQDKDKQREEHTGFDIKWSDIKNIHKVVDSKTSKSVYIHSEVMEWLITSLYSDDTFGVKRCIDIVNLKRENIINNKIIFTSQKNKFKYESKPLSNHILEPLNYVLMNTTSKYIITNNKRLKITADVLTKRLNKIFGHSSQYLRRLWASYHYSKQPTAQELINQAYELTHSIDTHLNDYVLAYDEDDYEILGIYTFIEISKFKLIKKKIY